MVPLVIVGWDSEPKRAKAHHDRETSRKGAMRKEI